MYTVWIKEGDELTEAEPRRAYSRLWYASKLRRELELQGYKVVIRGDK